METRAPAPGAAETFTGAVTLSPLFQARPERPSVGAEVRFAPGARTAWHSHPAGQTLIVTAGNGWVQAWGGEKRAIKAGDVIWTPPGVKHWHGAAGDHAMTHFALQGVVDGVAVQWMEHVSDAQYDR
ncbi:MAG: cupin domain-containing protein [Hyphomonadaceae bacterium]